MIKYLKLVVPLCAPIETRCRSIRSALRRWQVAVRCPGANAKRYAQSGDEEILIGCERPCRGTMPNPPENWGHCPEETVPAVEQQPPERHDARLRSKCRKNKYLSNYLNFKLLEI